MRRTAGSRAWALWVAVVWAPFAAWAVAPDEPGTASGAAPASEAAAPVPVPVPGSEAAAPAPALASEAAAPVPAPTSEAAAPVAAPASEAVPAPASEAAAPVAAPASAAAAPPPAPASEDEGFSIELGAPETDAPLDGWYLGVGVGMALAWAFGDDAGQAAASADEFGMAYGGHGEITFELAEIAQVSGEFHLGAGPLNSRLYREAYGASGSISTYHTRLGATARGLSPVAFSGFRPFVAFGVHREHFGVAFRGDDPLCPAGGDEECVITYDGWSFAPGLGVRAEVRSPPTVGDAADLAIVFLQVDYAVQRLDEMSVEPGAALPDRRALAGSDPSLAQLRVRLGGQYLF